MTLRWYPQGLNAAIQRGFEASLARVAADANATSPAKEAGALIKQTGPTSAVLSPTKTTIPPKAHIWREAGTVATVAVLTTVHVTGLGTIG